MDSTPLCGCLYSLPAVLRDMNFVLPLEVHSFPFPMPYDCTCPVALLRRPVSVLSDTIPFSAWSSVIVLFRHTDCIQSESLLVLVDREPCDRVCRFWFLRPDTQLWGKHGHGAYLFHDELPSQVFPSVIFCLLVVYLFVCLHVYISTYRYFKNSIYLLYFLTVFSILKHRWYDRYGWNFLLIDAIFYAKVQWPSSYTSTSRLSLLFLLFYGSLPHFILKWVFLKT